MEHTGQVNALRQGEESARDLIKETTTASFRQDVIAESARQPVLVDFWAPWCQPCKQLTPVLESTVRRAAGKVKLVKLNIDDHPQIPGQLGIQSIPAVIAFQKGQPVDGFMGALPESQVQGFIERLVGPVGDSLKEVLDQAEAAAAEGETQTAADLFAAVLTQDENNLRATGGLARLYVALGEFDQARELLAQVPPDKENDPAVSAARAALTLAERASSVD